LSETDANDVAQETIISLYKAMPNFSYDPKRCRFRTWVFRLTKLRIIDWHRRGTKGTDTYTETPGEETLPEDPASVSLWNEEWERFIIEAAIDGLCQSRRLDRHAAQTLHELYVHHRDSRETATILGRSPQEVHRTHSRWKGPLQDAVAEVRRSLNE